MLRAAQIFDFFSGETLRLAGEKLPSTRPGIDVELTREPVGVVGIITPWNFPIAIPAWKIAPALCLRQLRRLQAGRPGAGLGLGAVGHHHPRGRAGRRVQSRHGPRFCRRRRHPQQPRHRRHHLHRLGRHWQESRCGLRRAYAQIPARDGRQEPARRARRRGPQRRGRRRRQWRVLLDRPALHGFVAHRRHGGHSRQLRRGSRRAPERPRRRRCAQGRHAYRPGRRPEPARPGQFLHRHRQVRRREARFRRRASVARKTRLLPAAGAVHRDPGRCASTARRFSGRSPA